MADTIAGLFDLLDDAVAAATIVLLTAIASAVVQPVIRKALRVRRVSI